jgi:hypothetical protein
LFFVIIRLPFDMTETLSIKISKETMERLKAVARKKTTPSGLIREAIELILVSTVSVPKTSIYHLSADLFENHQPEGPRDLSINPKYLEDLGR